MKLDLDAGLCLLHDECCNEVTHHWVVADPLRLPLLLALLAVAKAAREPGVVAYHSWLWEVLQGGIGDTLTEIRSDDEASSAHALCMTQVWILQV